MALSEKKRISNDKWIKENYRQVKLSMPKSEAELLNWYCTTYDLSKAGFIRKAIKEKMAKDASNRPVDDYYNSEELNSAPNGSDAEPDIELDRVVQVIVRPRQGDADRIRTAAVKSCQSIQAYILQAAEERIRRESNDID